MTPELTILTELPAGILDSPAPDLHRLLDGPTLIHLNGREPRPLFSVALQHGNETAGWEAARQILKHYRTHGLPRAWSIFVANVGAARYKVRQLDGQLDFNRCWPGALDGNSPMHELMRQVTDEMRARRPFASVDVHNNTGLNPHYGAVTMLRCDNLRLAALFSHTVLYFTTPKGVQTAAFAPFCPAVTVECGRVGGQEGIEHAAQYLDACLNLSELPNSALPEDDLFVYHTLARVRVKEDLSFGFEEPDLDISFEADLDRLNFKPLPRGTRIARVAPAAGYGVVARDETGRDVTQDFFLLRDGELRIARPVMPSMLTRNQQVIRQDCLCYLMEEIAIDPPAKNQALV